MTYSSKPLHLSIAYKLCNESTREKLEHPLLAILESVHETGSISQAAKHLGRSYRYVWGELKHWELELNTDLIVWGRTSKGVRLTPQALAFLSEIAKAHVDLEREIALIKNRVEQCIAVLKTAPNTPSMAIKRPFIPTFSVNDAF
jgi:molybdate transport repressor ModE-like protein